MSNERSESAVVDQAEEQAETVSAAENQEPAQEQEPDYTAQLAALKVAALQIHLHGE